MDAALQAAFRSLGLEAESSFDDARQRYRKMAMQLHPDRVAGAADKARAEQNMKKLNGQFELIERHFKDGNQKKFDTKPSTQPKSQKRQTQSSQGAKKSNQSQSTTKPDGSEKSSNARSGAAKPTAAKPSAAKPVSSERIMQDAARAIWRNRVAFKQLSKAQTKPISVESFILRQPRGDH
jgi:DnaJ-class molecular chaperone